VPNFCQFINLLLDSKQPGNSEQICSDQKVFCNIKFDCNLGAHGMNNYSISNWVKYGRKYLENKRRNN
jgi:hypothetical protein